MLIYLLIDLFKERLFSWIGWKLVILIICRMLIYLIILLNAENDAYLYIYLMQLLNYLLNAFKF